MKRKNSIIIFSLLVIITGIVLMLSYLGQYVPKYKWHENYRFNNDQPYGLEILYSTLKDTYKKNFILLKTNIKKELTQAENNSNYIFVGNNLITDSSEVKSLLEFVHKGNNALIACNYFPVYLMDELFTDTTIYCCDSFYLDSVITTSFIKPNKEFPFHYQFIEKKINYGWRYFNLNKNSSASVNSLKILSNINDKCVNFLEVDYGKGKFLLHHNPILFTNYYFIEKNGFDYANLALSNLNSGKILWDEASKSMFHSGGAGKNLSQSPVEFIISNKGLKHAWYLGLITILLYLLFRSKREQQIIPVTEQNVNTTVEYSKAVSSLYYKTKEHKHIAKEMMKQFRHYVKIKYHVTIGKNKEEISPKLSQRSEIQQTVIDQIFKLENKVLYYSGHVEKELIELYNTIEYFYKNCK